ncbi:NUMOD4 domain-containing protein [Candidatus Xianfuyuplasma coldseepsis]|uniref:NUMOD4 domain-containing protein n=1 Tax=Candidatus Xianfuyuplasma coldseepsis TaxID=2782163 RepID=A0A7L7KS78_9MOLU|nr:NUMOD4 domain-containing protein [Xianfuyuplasma coldseepsis]QMS85112.1 hypothetical protein G4Z02_04925 [Xianfuyuplasma coldseepsis]
MTEIWRKLKGYETKYLISSHGRIKVKNTGHIMSEIIYNDRPYITLTQFSVSKNLPLSRLVAVNFIENPDKLKYVRHKDNNQMNNKSGNLYWSNSRYRGPNTFIYMYDFQTGEEIQIWKSIRSISLWFRKKEPYIKFDADEFNTMLKNNRRFSMYGYTWELLR